MVRVRILAALFGLAMLCAAIHAQQGPNTAKPAAKEAPRKEEVRYGADLWKGPWDGDGVLTLKGNVWFEHESTRLTSDLIEYDARKDVKTAVSPGKITISNPDCDISADKGTAYFIKKLVVIEGSVVMQVKPKAESEGAKSDSSVRSKISKPTTVSCSRLEYLYKEKIAAAKGGVTFTQDKRKVTAQEAVYDQNKELLTLTGNVEGADEEGQTFSAPKVVISFKKGDEWIEVTQGKAVVKVNIEEEEKQPTESKSTP